MCGLAGIWQRDGSPVEPARLRLMTESLRHRGPDGDGHHVVGDIALGHRRLKIIDLSANGAQPFWLPDRSLAVVFNGEIHNYRELALELRAAGVRLRTQSDTEVLLWCYRLWGTASFERLNGMWAAAFWHAGADARLVLTRDRFGVKPLVYSQRGARFAFASEPKALLAAFPDEARTDTQLVADFARGGVPDADSHTFFANIRSLRPGETLTVTRTAIAEARWWRFEPGTERPRPHAAEELASLLRDSVRLRMRSDVPVGVALSGGLDSSLVARHAAAEATEPVHCFSLRHERARIDESRYAAAVADDERRYRIHWVSPGAGDLIETTARIVWHHDAPTPIRGRWSQWHLMQHASRHVRVLLDGQGADELLAGYPRFVLPWLLDRLDPRLTQRASRVSLPRELLQLGRVANGAHRLLPRLLHKRFGPRPALDSLLDADLCPAPLAAHRRIGGWAAPGAERPWRSRLNNALWFELRHAGLPEILHSEDALSMAFSLESRLPFLDHRIVELCFSLPFDDKLRDGWTKWLLRTDGGAPLPEVVRWRRHKLGFPADYSGLLASARGVEQLRSVLLERTCLERGVLSAAWLRRNLGGSAGRAQQWVRRHLLHAWALLTLELFNRLFIDRDRSLLPCPLRSAA